MSSITDARFSASTVLIVAAIVGAGAFAAGRSLHSEPASASVPVAAEPPAAMATSMSMSTGAEALPPGHPPVDTSAPAANAPAEVAESSLAWKVPARWQVVPNTSTMRLATYRIPHAPGDDEDPEMAVSQAGGSLDANIDRWIGQFGPEAKKTAKRTTRKVAGMDVTIVEIEGTFAGGMGMKNDQGPSEGWALLGAIVETPGMPHFFKMTGPAKSVRAARAELDTLVASLGTH
jgi:hypothetical protein